MRTDGNARCLAERIIELMEMYGILRVWGAIIENKDKLRAVWDTDNNLEVAKVNNSLQVIEYKEQRVLTSAQLAEQYGTTAKRISNNFNENKGRYTFGKHYYTLENNDLKAFKGDSRNSGLADNINKLYLWTKHGALLHAKSLNTDKAWATYEYLIDHYFATQEAHEAIVSNMSDYQRMMMESRQENARIRKAQLYTRLANKYPGTYSQVLDSYATFELTGQHLLPLPAIGQKTYSATEIGKRLGISANMVGILANRHELKNDTYGIWCNDKAKGHNKEVTTFRYYKAVVPVLQGYLDKAPKALD